ncbi:MAG: right-handed parallel beta-helix repeat-containing protein, partial [Planctomycetales bacterium]|nr:right-handed parallel beta-helix repeat-containing protein [Planctomycetales bacterium]
MIYSRIVALLGFTASLSFAQTPDRLQPQVYRIEPSDDVQFRLQDLLVKAVPGDVIEFSSGRFELNRQIDIATDNITLRGQGSDQTILSFRGQQSGGQGIEATGNNFVVESLAVEDTAGNAIKVNGSKNVTFREVRVEWTGEAKSSNGAYGLYPVQCENVLIEACVAKGASDSGIYVGQSRRVIVRNCLAERNVAGIEIENTVDADVYDNVATNNAGGLLVFDLPGLQLKAGQRVRLFRNKVNANNHKNFAAEGNIVAMVPSGTGVMVLATDQVEIFDNEIMDNQTSNISVVSYLISGKKVKDPDYDPYCKTVSIHDNQIARGGQKPSGLVGKMLMPVLGATLPDILFDGMTQPVERTDNNLAVEKLAIWNNGDATFADFKLAELNPSAILTGKYKASRDLTPHSKARPAALPAVALLPHEAPVPTADPTIMAYRSAPERLSEWGFFEGNGASQTPVTGVVPYDLNTPLFSDYTSKYRFIRIPPGSQARFTESGVLDFPDGTVIAKTFAYPHDERDLSQGERLLETRIELRQGDAWVGYAYQWNQEQTDATLLLGGGEVQVSWIRKDGQTFTHRYEIPNANQCLNCHSQDKAFVPLGPTARNLNRSFEYTGGHANQLSHLAKLGQLAGLPDQVETFPVADDSATGSLHDRAKAWLDVNCAHCHSPHGTARTSGLDLRFDQTDPSKYGVWKSPVAAGHGSGGHDYDIVPGQP